MPLHPKDQALLPAAIVSIVGLAILCGGPAWLYVWTVQTIAAGVCP